MMAKVSNVIGAEWAGKFRELIVESKIRREVVKLVLLGFPYLFLPVSLLRRLAYRIFDGWDEK